MTKRDAAEKIAKLLKLARGTSNIHEGATARAQAAKIAREHNLSSSDLATGAMCSAFDELLDQVPKFVSSQPETNSLFDVRSIIGQVVRSIKDVGDADKAARLRQITYAIRAASILAGDNKTISQLKTALDTSLKNHDLVI